MLGRSRSDSGTRITGPILFPVTIPDSTWLLLPAPARRPRKERHEPQVRVMGSLLFPVTLPIGVVRVAADSGLLSGKQRSEQFLAQPSPRLPRHEGITFGTASLLFHAAVLMTLVALGRASMAPTAIAGSDQAARTHPETPRLVVLLEPVRPGPGGGGGGGGNRQRRPIPRAQAPGRDAVTLPVATPIAPTTQPREVPPPQAVALDAKPLASGLVLQVGSLDGRPTLGTSQGPGSGGGVGDGVGTGIGSGRGPGFGPGSGGGTGGRLYRPGGQVIPPTLLREVKPTYTVEALRAKIQGSVLLEVVVQRDGTPRDIRVFQSLDPKGLDLEAVRAVERWRFSPGRLNGVPVDVLVTIALDFSIR
jgi:periplasmic protein TonB